MKVGIVCPYVWDVPGGVRSHVADLAQALHDHGHEVDVLAPLDDPSAAPSWVSDGGRPIAVSYNGAVARLSFGVKATRRVRAWIREGNFDIVHIHEPLAPSLSLLTCWSARGPLVATWHSSHDRSRILAAGYGIAQTAMEKIRGSIAVSEEARRTLVAHVGGDAVLIPNGVRVASFVDATPLDRVDPSCPSVLFLGRIDEPRKGLDVLIAALPRVIERFPDLIVLVAGPGDQEEQIKKNGEYVAKKYAHSSDFIGPGLVTLDLINVAPLNTNVIVPNIREPYAYCVTEKTDGDRHLLFVNDKGRIYLINTNMNIIFTGSKTEEQKSETVIDGSISTATD